jgi:hypothetical protein
VVRFCLYHWCFVFIIFVDLEEDENQQSKTPIHHRSHDSLIYQGKDDSSGYSTLPRNFKQNVIKNKILN